MIRLAFIALILIVGVSEAAGPFLRAAGRHIFGPRPHLRTAPLIISRARFNSFRPQRLVIAREGIPSAYIAPQQFRVQRLVSYPQQIVATQTYIAPQQFTAQSYTAPQQVVTLQETVDPCPVETQKVILRESVGSCGSTARFRSAVRAGY